MNSNRAKYDERLGFTYKLNVNYSSVSSSLEFITSVFEEAGRDINSRAQCYRLFNKNIINQNHVHFNKDVL